MKIYFIYKCKLNIINYKTIEYKLITNVIIYNTKLQLYMTSIPGNILQ
jgi:hypothetical protein